MGRGRHRAHVHGCRYERAGAAPAGLVGEGAPVGQSGIQLYNFSSYLSNGAGEILCPASPAPPTPYCVGPTAPTTTMARMERLFAFLQSRGVKNVELYGYPGNPFPSGRRRTATRRARWSCARWATSTASASRAVTAASTRRAGTPRSRSRGSSARITSASPGRAAPVASAPTSRRCSTAEQLNKLGKRSVELGLGPAYFHNHAAEFGATRASWTTACSRAAGRS